jgi:hypothetical protein
MSKTVPALLSFLLLVGCNMELTHDPASYDALGTDERSAADRIFANLQAYDARLQAVSSGRHRLGPIALERDRIDVSLHGYWVMTDIGDDRIHLTVWQNLTDEQTARWASWFGEPLDAAASRYARFFYDFLALHLAGVQTVFAIQGVDWVYDHRHVFNLDRDAQRLVVTYLREMDNALFDFVWNTCGTIRGVFDSRWGSSFNMTYYGDNIRELTDPADPAGQIYFICRHMEQAELRRVTWSSTFLAEIDVLERYLTGDY